MPDVLAPQMRDDMRDDDAFDADLAAEALAGLTATPPTLPAKLLYDAEGCRLFGEITRLPEYYPTRTERALLAGAGAEIAAACPTGAALVEYGASDEGKAALLLAHLASPAGYVPIDIAPLALDGIVARLARARPGLRVHPIVADFLAPLALPPDLGDAPRFGFFPGSTIGNLDRPTAARFLRQARQTLGEGALFLVGVDLRKDPAVLVPAYDDAAGTTAAFNLNLLHRLNREARADFDVGAFAHRAIWNGAESRIEMHLQSRRDQVATVAGTRIAFRAGETIHTENSYKYGVAQFHDLAATSGWRPARTWQDGASLFSLHLLRG